MRERKMELVMKRRDGRKDPGKDRGGEKKKQEGISERERKQESYMENGS